MNTFRTQIVNVAMMLVVALVALLLSGHAKAGECHSNDCASAMLVKQAWIDDAKLHDNSKVAVSDVDVTYPTRIGTTPDGKYPIYKLVAHLRDFSFVEKQGSQLVMWNDVDLYNILKPIDAKDVHGHGYYCDNAICINARGNIVGSRPHVKIKD